MQLVSSRSAGINKYMYIHTQENQSIVRNIPPCGNNILRTLGFPDSFTKVQSSWSHHMQVYLYCYNSHYCDKHSTELLCGFSNVSFYCVRYLWSLSHILLVVKTLLNKFQNYRGQSFFYSYSIHVISSQHSLVLSCVNCSPCHLFFYSLMK